jgi:hypothetical protein
MKTWVVVAGISAAASGLVGADGYRAEIRFAEYGMVAAEFEGAPRLAGGGLADGARVAAQAALFDGVWSLSRSGGVAAWSGEAVPDEAPVEILPGLWVRRIDGSASAALYEVRLENPEAGRDGGELAPLAATIGEICFDLPAAPGVAAPAGLRIDDGRACLETGPISGERRLVLAGRTG